MRIDIHVRAYNDWQPVPEGLKVTEQDVASGRAKPATNGGHVMRVPIAEETVVHAQITEAEIIAQIVHAYVDKGKQGLILTRHEAVAQHLGTSVVPHWTNRKHIKFVMVHDDGPSEELFLATIKPHLEADHGRAPGKNIDAEDVPEMLEAYLTPFDSEDADHPHVEGLAKDHGHGIRAHVHAHFKVKPASSAASASKGSV